MQDADLSWSTLKGCYLVLLAMGYIKPCATFTTDLGEGRKVMNTIAEITTAAWPSARIMFPPSMYWDMSWGQSFTIHCLVSPADYNINLFGAGVNQIN